MRLLLVEDDSFFALLITEYLSDNSIDVVTASTAQEALQIDIQKFDGAVIDVMLPNDPEFSGISQEEARGGYLAGIALTRRLKREKPNFPIVLLSSDIVGGEARSWARENSVPFVLKYEDRSRLLSALADVGLVQIEERPRTFIVHGHDESTLAELKDYIQNTLHWPEPIVLREKPNSGRTIIEKFEEYAGLIDWVFVLITPDDLTFNPSTDDERRRARQNVIFELGFL